MSSTPKIVLDFFDDLTKVWRTAGQIWVLNHQANRWSAFGAGERVITEAEDGLFPEFCNIIRYPSIRVMLSEERALPYTFSFRIPRLQPVFTVPELVYGYPREIPNFLGELSAKSWGFVYLNGPWIPIEPPAPPRKEFDGVILYENLTEDPMPHVLTVKMHKYLAGTLNVFRNGNQEKRKDPGVLDFTWEELNPDAGTFFYTGPWHPEDDTLTVQYAYPKG